MKKTGVHSQQAGFIFGLIAYLTWGFSPLYFKAMSFVSLQEITAHRIIWTAVLTLILLRGFGKLVKIIKTPKVAIGLFASSMLITTNWLIFFWAIESNHLIEASLGYYINPLFTLALSMMFFGERFRPLQWAAIILVIIAIIWPLWKFGTVPWIALGLATTFGIYGLIRKKLNVSSLPGLCFETICAIPIAIILMVSVHTPTSNLLNNTILLNMALMAAGVVTTVPLLAYAAAVKRIRLSTLGMMQYLGPSIMFLLAITGFSEKITNQQIYMFSFVWLALGIYSLDAIRHRKKTAVVTGPR